MHELHRWFYEYEFHELNNKGKNMRIVRAKVLATGEERYFVEKENEPGVFLVGLSDKEYKADELEILAEPTAMEQPAFGGVPQMPDTTAMMKEMLDSLKSHFWRDQRVEIAKILLQRRMDVDIPQVAEKAEEIIQQLKAYGD